jgi:hypothetical protein
MNSELNPIGEYPNSAICETLGHSWYYDVLLGHGFRFCYRCKRHERRENEDWIVNKISPSIV